MKITDTPMPVAVTEDGYRILGNDVTLVTDSAEVRDFFRAAYRRFRLEQPAQRGVLKLEAIMSPAQAGPYVCAGERRLNLAGRPMPGNRAFLFLLNALMDRVRDYFLIHGAALRVGDRGIIVAGRPGSGKSTLAIELARRGATLLSDDVAALSRRDGRLHPFPRAVGIRRDGARLAGFDPAAAEGGLCHPLPHKWLVDPEALGVTTSDAGGPSCSLDAVLFLDTGDEGTGREMEIALAEEDSQLLEEIGSIPGITALRRVEAEYPLFRFGVEETGRPMKSLSSLCNRRNDIVLYVDEARPESIVRETEPRIEEAGSRTFLMALTADLLNRSETGELFRSCGGLAGMVSELGHHLGRARSYTLRPGSPADTADHLFSLLESDNKGEVIR